MLRYLRRVGLVRALRYVLLAPFVEAACALPWAPARAAALRLLGARLGPGTWVERIRLWNYYAAGLGNLQTGPRAYLGPGALLDLANPIRIGADVLFGPNVTVLTHINVGPDHPLAEACPHVDAPVEIGDGAGVSVGATIFPGARIPPRTIVPPQAVVRPPRPPA